MDSLDSLEHTIPMSMIRLALSRMFVFAADACCKTNDSEIIVNIYIILSYLQILTQIIHLKAFLAKKNQNHLHLHTVVDLSAFCVAHTTSQCDYVHRWFYFIRSRHHQCTFLAAAIHIATWHSIEFQ